MMRRVGWLAAIAATSFAVLVAAGCARKPDKGPGAQPQSAQTWLAGLKRNSPEARERAARELGKLPPEEIKKYVPELKAALKAEKSQPIKETIRETLSKAGETAP